MSHKKGFLYFYECNSGLTIDESVFEDYPHLKGNTGSVRETNCGPSGGKGFTFAIKNNDIEVGFYPQNQTWEKAGKLWVGYYEKPVPSDLIRPNISFKYYTLQLLDNNDWGVVIARSFANGENFPEVLKLDDSGDVVSDGTLKSFVKYSGLIEKHKDNIKISKDFVSVTDITTNELFLSSSDLLGCMYFVGAREISILRILTNQLCCEIFGKASDAPFVQHLMSHPELNEELKKKSEFLESYEENMEVIGAITPHLAN